MAKAGAIAALPAHQTGDQCHEQTASFDGDHDTELKVLDF